MRETVARTERIKELFAQAMSLPAADRPAMLERECDEPGMRDAVANLLNDYDSAQQFFAQFPDNFARQALGLATTPPVFAIGDLVAGRFRIIGFLGAGGMGEVYEAEDQLLDHEHVALKTLSTDIGRDPRAIERLKRELALARKVTHPNVCRVFDVDEHVPSSGPTIPFFTMELLKGETLAARLQRSGPMSAAHAHPLIAQMAAALTAAHAAGIVHGDFKPGNVVLVPSPDGTERVVVADFGLARQDTAVLSANTSRAAWGTPVYMAPEQFAGQRPTRATDVYALAAVALEIVTGKRPFERDAAVVRALDPAWRAAFDRGLAHDPAARFDSADDVLRALGARPSRPRRLWPLAAASIAVMLTPLLFSPVRERLREGFGSAATVTTAERQNAVVLPFTATSETPDDVTFALGLSAAITDHLPAEAPRASRPLLVPIVLAVADAVRTPAQAHRALGADLIVTGTVDRTAKPSRITLELHRVSGQQVAVEQRRSVQVNDGESMLTRAGSAVAELIGMGPHHRCPRRGAHRADARRSPTKHTCSAEGTWSKGAGISTSRRSNVPSRSSNVPSRSTRGTGPCTQP